MTTMASVDATPGRLGEEEGGHLFIHGNTQSTISRKKILVLFKERKVGHVPLWLFCAQIVFLFAADVMTANGDKVQSGETL